MAGLAQGIHKNMGLVTKEVAALSEAMSPTISADMLPYRSGSMPIMPVAKQNAAAASSGAATYNMTINISQMASDYDARRAAETISRELERMRADNNSLIGVSA